MTFAGNGAMAPAELGLRLGISGGATTSLLSVLAQEGKVRICRVRGDAEMEERQTLRQATKLWQEEIDAEFGRPYNDIGVYLMRRGNLDEAMPWLQKAKQARRCEPRAVPVHESGADLP